MIIKTRSWFALITVLITITTLLVPGSATSAQDPAGSPESALLDMLRYVPDGTGASEIYFGDLVAWYASWNVPRPPTLKMLDLLPAAAHARWMFNMPYQTALPEALGMNYVILDEMRPFYGFDLFQVDRFVYAGGPPDDLTIVESAIIDEAQIADSLTAAGYAAETLDGWTIYNLHGDYEHHLNNQDIPRVGKLGQLNRIALAEDVLLIARATSNITASLETLSSEAGSLADNPLYVAGASALADPALDDTGELVGAILMGNDVAGDPAMMLGPGATAENSEAWHDSLFPDGVAPLPLYDLVAFGTRHSSEQGATFLILGVVFPPGTDAQQATGVLKARLETYESLRSRRPLEEIWSFDRAFATEAAGLPVAVLVMRINDSAPETISDEALNARVFTWIDLLFVRDLGFLVPGPFEE